MSNGAKIVIAVLLLGVLFLNPPLILPAIIGGVIYLFVYKRKMEKKIFTSELEHLNGVNLKDTMGDADIVKLMEADMGGNPNEIIRKVRIYKSDMPGGAIDKNGKAIVDENSMIDVTDSMSMDDLINVMKNSNTVKVTTTRKVSKVRGIGMPYINRK